MLTHAWHLGNSHLHGDLRSELPSTQPAPYASWGLSQHQVPAECSDILGGFPRKAGGSCLGKLQSSPWVALTCVFCLTAQHTPLTASCSLQQHKNASFILAPVTERKQDLGSSLPALPKGAFCFQTSYVKRVNESLRRSPAHGIVNHQNIQRPSAQGPKLSDIEMHSAPPASLGFTKDTQEP